MSKRINLIKECNKLNLPIDIQFTALSYLLKTSKYDLNTYILLACKTNDCYLELDASDYDLCEELNYDFYIQSPTQKICGILLYLQENNLINEDYEILWNKCMSNLSKLINYYKLEDEMSFFIACFDLDKEIFDFIDYKKERVNELRKCINNN